MKYIWITVLALSTSACTPEIRQMFSRELNEAKNYSYIDLAYNLSGIKKAQLSKKERHDTHLNNLCFHEDAHEREISANGIEDHINYRHCTLTNSLGNEHPQRLDGR